MRALKRYAVVAAAILIATAVLAGPVLEWAPTPTGPWGADALAAIQEETPNRWLVFPQVSAWTTSGFFRLLVPDGFTDIRFTCVERMKGQTVNLKMEAIGTPLIPERMATIPAGLFEMGDTFAEGGPEERPVHTVYVSAFYLDKVEVTKALWGEVHAWATAHGYSFDNAGAGKASNHPVQNICWYDVVKWCNARSEKEGLTPCYYTSAAQTTVYRTGQVSVATDWLKWGANGYRLPTEAEWEKAARGGLAGNRFPWGNTITHSQANYYSYWDGGHPYYSCDLNLIEGYHPDYDDGGYPYTSPVGSFAPNGYGLYDMAGNVWEWCWDWYDSGWYGRAGTSATDPRGPSSGSARVLRGGGWGSTPISLRCAYRLRYWPDFRFNRLGFRCARGRP